MLQSAKINGCILMLFFEFHPNKILGRDLGSHCAFLINRFRFIPSVVVSGALDTLIKAFKDTFSRSEKKLKKLKYADKIALSTNTRNEGFYPVFFFSSNLFLNS